MLKVKVCGITNLQDALLCEVSGADMLGFVFYGESARAVSVDAVRSIIKKLSPFTARVGVFVNEPAEKINTIAGELGLTAVQLHGDEQQEIISEIKFPVIKSFRISDNFDFEELNKFSGIWPLLDTYTKKSYGGTGKSFNWDAIPESIRDGILLAGGVSATNIEYIYKHIMPLGVDLSSSLENSPGKKDYNKVTGFFRIINELRNK